MDLKQLRYFVRVAELGSFVRAADLLGVAQPTLSRQVRALEVDIHANLFHRNGRGVLLTPAGVRFLEQAHGVLHAAEVSLQVLHGSDRRLSGRVVCGVTPSVGQMMIPEYVRRFTRELPDATLSISNHLSASLHEQLRASRLDFAILHSAAPSASLTITPLDEQPLFVVGCTRIGRDGDTVSLKALHKLPLVMPPEAHAVRKTVELAAARVGITLNIRFEVDAIDALFQLVADGFGHTIATGITARRQGDRHQAFVQRITAPRLTSELSLVTVAQRNMTPLQAYASALAQRTFIDLSGRPAVAK